MIKTYSGSYYGNYRTRTFSEIWPEVTDFLTDYNAGQIPVTIKETDSLTPTTLYYLLYAKYGNSHIASMDEQQFKFKLLSEIWLYAPAVNKKREIQQKLINLTDDELIKGSQLISNIASNPSSEPSSDSLEALTYINEQHTNTNVRGKLDAYANLYEILKQDIINTFLSKFKHLFITIVEPEMPLLYEEI